MATKLEFAQKLKERGATREQAKQAFDLFAKKGGVFDDYRSSSVIDQVDSKVLTSKNNTPAEDETFEKSKTLAYLESSGYGVPAVAADQFKEQVAKGSTYASFNKILAKQLDVQQLGPVKSSAKTRKQDVNALIYANATKSPFEVPAMIAERDARLAIDDASQGADPLRGFADAYVSGLGGSVGNAIDSYGGMLMLLGDAIGSSYISNEGRGISTFSQNLRMAGGTKEAWDKFIGSDNLFRDTKKYQIFEGLGRIGGYASMGGAAPAAIWSDIHNGVREKVAEYTDEETASKYAWLISTPLSVVSSKSINDILKQAPLASSSTPKAFVGQVMRRFANKIPASLFEAGTEVSEDFIPDVAFGGKEAVKQNIQQYVDSFVISVILTGIVDVGAGIKADTDQSTAFNAYKKHLTNKGWNEESASRISEEIVSGMGKTEGDALKHEAQVDAVIQEEAKNDANKKARIQALEDFESAVNDGSKDVDTEVEITGANGAPLTSVDVEILRNQPELVDALDDSPAAEVLKDIVLNGQDQRIPEYNQMLAGVEEKAPDAETPAADQAPAQQSAGAATGQTPVEIAEKPADQTLADLEREMRSDKTEQKDYSDYSMPEEGETDDNGVPRLIGMSRKFNQQWNDELELGGVPNAQRVEWATTLNNAYKMNLHQRTKEMIDKVKSGKQLNSDEIAGLLIAKADLANKIEANAIEIRKADEAGDTERATELRLMQGQMISQTIQLAETALRAGTENARALAAMAMVMDRKSFTLENIMALATQMKGGELDADVSQKLTDLHQDLKAVEQELEAVEDGEQEDPRDVLIEEVERAIRRIRKPTQKKEDKNADLKLIKKRQDQIFGLIEELNGRKPTKEEKALEPDSEGYLEMIQELKRQIAEKKAGDRKVAQNIKLIEKRDAVLAEIENMHRDIKEVAAKAEKSKLEKDIAIYEQARRDQDTIAELIRQIREGRTENKPVTQEDIYGYKQTIQSLRQELYRKEGIQKLESEIASLEKQLETGEFEEKAPSNPRKVDEVTQRLRDRKAELNKQIEMQKEREALWNEVETASRRIKEKKAKGEDTNADVKLAKKYQDRLFTMIDEINRGKPQKDKIKKVKEPDSEGYSKMIEALEPELKNSRRIRRLEADVKRMEDALDSGDLSAYKKQPKRFKEETKEVRELMAKKLALQQEINRRIQNEAPVTFGKAVAKGYDMFRTAKLTLDFGHIFRQGGANITDIRLWLDGSNIKMLGKTFTSLRAKGAINEQLDVRSSQYYELGQQAGLRIPTEGENLTGKEQLKMSGIFGRSQVAGTAAIRQSLFDSIVSQYGGDITFEEAKDVAFAVNILTGYGQYKSSGGGIERALNVLLISPRFRASRFQAASLLLLSRDGRRIANNKILRNRIIENQAQFFLSRAMIVGLAAALWPDEVKVILDPKHWAFGRIAVETESGQWRVYNPWAGLSTAYSFLVKFAKTGDPLSAMLDSTKTAGHPFFSFMKGMWTGELYGGKKARRYEVAMRSVMPISAEGMVDSFFNETGTADIIFSTLADILGADNTLVELKDIENKQAPKRQQEKREQYEGWFQ